MVVIRAPWRETRTNNLSVPALDSCAVKKAGAVVHRQKVDRVLPNPIDGAVTTDYDFSDVFDS